MFTETSFGENSGEIKEDSPLTDLDIDIGKLRVSPVPYESSDVLVNGLLPDFDSIKFAELPEPYNDITNNTDDVGSTWEADPHGQRYADGKYTSRSYSRDFARTANPSRDEDGEDEVVDGIDILEKLNDPVVVYESSRRKSVRNSNIKLNQNTEFQNLPRNCSKIPKKTSALDVNSLKISRRRRSLIPKQARSSVWGLLENISPDFEENCGNDPNVGNEKKLIRVIGAQGKKSAVTEKPDRKSFQKSRPTGHITLKIKIGNQSCGMVHVTKDLNASEKSTPDLSKIMESKFGERLSKDMTVPQERTLDNVLPSDVSVMATHLDVRGSVENSSFTMSSDLHQIISREEGNNIRDSTENRCSDTGTSPDSEVINSVPDATLYEKGLQNMQDSPIMPMDRISQECFTNSVADVSFGDVSSLSLPQKKSTKGKKKDKHHQLGDCGVKNQLIGAKTTSSAKAPLQLESGLKAVDVAFCNDVSTIGTAKTYLNTNCGNGVSRCSSRFSRMTNLGNPSIASKVSNGLEVNLSPGLLVPIESSNSQASDTLIPCSNGHKLSKCSRAKEQLKSRCEILGITSKKDEESKRSDKNNLICKHQIVEKADASGASNGVEIHMVSGNQTSSDPGKTEYLSKSLREPLNSLELSSGGLMEQFAPPRNAWVLCDECQKWRRIPATLADHIEETNSGWTCKDNTDTDFSKCSIPQELSNSEINKELEISDVEEDARDTLRTSNQNHSKAIFAVQQSSSWSLIKSNLFRHRNRKTQTIDEVMVCHCKPPLDGKTGCRAKCLNRMLNIECVRGTCPCGELCSNQQFQKRKYAKLKWFRCGKKGFGLQALEDISHGKFLIEYVGEVLDIRAYEGRQKEYALEGHKHFYFMTLNGSEVIDACAKGNLGRFINHSCDPNCRTEKWMVKGEVCVGLFAVRDIKKGEEVTFDYNYVRVFGAAAKKCVCGAPNCRGYIGGDPTNSEVVQVDSDDEFAEPVMTCDEREMKADWNAIISNSLPNIENESANELPKPRHRRKKSVNAAAQIENITSEPLIQKVGVSSACGDGSVEKSTASQVLDILVQDNDEPENLVETVRLQSQVDSPVLPTDISSQSEDVMNDTLLSSAQKARRSEMKTPLLSNKSHANTIESKRKLKYATLGGKEELAKPNSVVKTRPPSSIKKGKIKSNVVNGKGTPDVNTPNASANKTKHLTDVSLKNHVETVEEKLNEMLDTDGGISTRKDASRGYLKLLFLTATSGTNGHGEAIQSTRDLLMILDAFLKTKSRTVLVDIINKNGLQMLHNIMKRYRKDFAKTPILRKLLKVLEYLAMREILTLEHITGGPPCPGVESFRDSILTLTEHGDRQVHQTARNFRDRFIPRYLRRKCFTEIDDCRKTDFLQRSSYNRLTSSPSDHPNNRASKPPEATVSSGTVEPSSATNCNNNYNGTTDNRIRKRKSRWDNPVEENPHYRIKTNSFSVVDIPPGFEDDSGPPGFSSPHKNHDSTPGFSPSCEEESAPPGFSSPFQSNTGVNPPFGTVLGNSQPKFVSSITVSYGVPYSVMRQDPENLKVAPGIPFLPFPPLPLFNKRGGAPTLVGKSVLLSESAERIEQGNNGCSASHLSGQKRSISPGVGSQQNGSSHSLGNKFFRQQKWSHVKQAPPWIRMRKGWTQASVNTRNCGPLLLGAGFGNGAN